MQCLNFITWWKLYFGAIWSRKQTTLHHITSHHFEWKRGFRDRTQSSCIRYSASICGMPTAYLRRRRSLDSMENTPNKAQNNPNERRRDNIHRRTTRNGQTAKSGQTTSRLPGCLGGDLRQSSCSCSPHKLLPAALTDDWAIEYSMAREKTGYFPYC